MLELKIPNTKDEDDASYIEDAISEIIPDDLTGYDGGDVTYTIIYSVMDKAGNESDYIARGVAIVSLLPELEIEEVVDDVTPVNNLQQVDDKTYVLNVAQGTDVNSVVQSLSLKASSGSQYITQTVYYNGELVVDDKIYNPNIYSGFTTNNPGVYEITYNLNFKYTGENGFS